MLQTWHRQVDGRVAAFGCLSMHIEVRTRQMQNVRYGSYGDARVVRQGMLTDEKIVGRTYLE